MYNYNLWKPYQGKGAAALFSASENNGVVSVFLKMMPENPDKPESFDNESAITVKLGLNDLGELLAVIRGVKAGAGKLKDDKWSGIYHQTDKSQSSILFERTETGFRLGVYRKDKNAKEGRRLGVGVTESESMILNRFIEQAVLGLLRETPRNRDQESSPESKETKPSKKRKSSEETPEKSTDTQDIPF